MKLSWSVVLSFCVSCAALAAEAQHLSLTSAEVERLGVELARPVAVSVVEIGTGPAEVVIPPGQEAMVSATVSGVISRLLVAEGEPVQLGQALAEIQSPQLLALQREFINALTANELVQAQLERDRGLHADGIIAERRLQETAAAAQVAAVQLDQSRQQLRLVGLNDDQLAALAERRLLSSALVLRSPLNGVVTEQLNSLGAQVDMLDPVYRVADLSRLWLEVRVAQEHATTMRAGLSAVVAVSDGEISAPVVHIGQVVDPTSQTVVMRAVLEDDVTDLRAGQFLRARIVAAASGPGVFALPAAAIVREGNENSVFVRMPDGFVLTAVDTVSDDGVRAFVASGLSADTEVAVGGVAALKSAWFASQAEDE